MPTFKVAIFVKAKINISDTVIQTDIKNIEYNSSNIQNILEVLTNIPYKFSKN